MEWILWTLVGAQGVVILMLVLAVGHLKNNLDRVWEALIGSSKATDQNFQFLAERVATVATIVGLALQSEASKEAANIDVKKVSPDGMLN